MKNEYLGLAKYYDEMTTNGYYDFKQLAKKISIMIEEQSQILDIGVGTGELIKEILQLKSYKFTGIDFSKKMIDQARVKLSKQNVKLVCQDLLIFKPEQPFDIVLSCGGVLYYVRGHEEDRLYSHIAGFERNRILIEKLYNMLKKGGKLVFSAQGEHVNYDRQLNQDLFYKQELHDENGTLRKWYYFSNA